MDHTELLFAAAVRNLALSLRHEEMLRYHDTVPYDLSATVRLEKLDRWREENPVVMFFPMALKAIDAAAEQIRKLRRTPA